MSFFSKIMGILNDGIPKQSFRAGTNNEPVGAGFYAKQHNISRAGISYTKLVKRDKSNLLNKLDPRRT